MNAKLGKGGTLLLGFLAGAASLVVVLQWYNAPQGKLRATIQVSDYAAPPSQQELQDTVHSAQWHAVGATKTVGAYLSGRVENGGSKEVKQVTLRVPDVAYFCVQREATGWVCRDKGSIVIGDLSPLEVATVQIWLSMKAFKTTLRDIHLTHSEGVGRVDFETVDLPKSFLRENMFLVFLTVGLLLLLLHMVLSDWNARKHVAWVKAREADAANKEAEEQGLEEAVARERANERHRAEIQKYL
jgi:hypothetical protein